MARHRQLKAKVVRTRQGAGQIPKWPNFTFLSSLVFPSPQNVRVPRPGRSLAYGKESATESEELGAPVSTAPVPCQPPPRGCWDPEMTRETAAARWRGLNPSLLLPLSREPGSSSCRRLEASELALPQQKRQAPRPAAAGAGRLRGALPLRSAHGRWPRHASLPPSQGLPPECANPPCRPLSEGCQGPGHPVGGLPRPGVRTRSPTCPPPAPHPCSPGALRRPLLLLDAMKCCRTFTPRSRHV